MLNLLLPMATYFGRENTDESRIYLDHNATTPLNSEVLAHLPHWAQLWGNPSSIHWEGRGPKNLIRTSRQKVAQMVGASPLEVVFTSGGSEANNLAIKGIYEALEAKDTQRNHYLFSSVEHPSVTKVMDYLRRKGKQVTRLSVNRQGQLSLDELKSHMSEKVALVSVMYANNETGHIFPVKKIGQMVHEVGGFFHCDGVQALGKAAVDVKKWGADLVSFSGHKFYALKGCGVLYLRQGLELEPLIHGGAQERQRRAGTENGLAIASLGHMAGQFPLVEEKAGQMKILRDGLEASLEKEIEGLTINGKGGKRLPNTVSVTIDGVDGETLLMNLDIKGFSVSTGAACGSGRPEPSPVLLAMGLSREQAQSSLRLSLGWNTTQESLELFVEVLKSVVSRLRSINRAVADF